MTNQNTLGPQLKTKLEAILLESEHIQFACLIGSRALDTAVPTSDWDFAIKWSQSDSYMERLGRIESLRRCLSVALDAEQNIKVDLVDLRQAGLAMRAEVAENGVLLAAKNPLVWHHFLSRTWRELEEVYWDDLYGEKTSAPSLKN